jgi:hypothetical protein
MNSNSGRQSQEILKLPEFVIYITIILCKIQHLNTRSLLCKIQLVQLMLVPTFLKIDAKPDCMHDYGFVLAQSPKKNVICLERFFTLQ